jgi:hypothetical protein
MSDLTEDLLSLGREWPVETRDDLADRVLAEIARPVPRTRKGFQWRRWLIAVGAVLAAIAISAAVSAPVRAAIAHVFRIGGIEVHSGAGPAPAASPSLPGQHPTSLAAASDQAGFTVRAPQALGAPDQVTVSTAGVVSLRYRTPGGPVQIDEFAEDISPMFEKYTAMGAAQKVRVNRHDGYWFNDPTVTIYLGPDGADPSTARQTNGTLIWVADGVTYRLDGIRPLSAALEVAATMQ